MLYLKSINIKNVKYCIDFAIVINDPMLTIFIRIENLAISIDLSNKFFLIKLLLFCLIITLISLIFSNINYLLKNKKLLAYLNWY